MKHQLNLLTEKYSSMFVSRFYETEISVINVEQVLNIRFLSIIKELLIHYGYGNQGAIPSLEDSVEATLRFREARNLPLQYVILEDKNDCGVVSLDTLSENASVLQINEFDELDQLVEGTLDYIKIENYHYPCFMDWLQYKIEFELNQK